LNIATPTMAVTLCGYSCVVAASCQMTATPTDSVRHRHNDWQVNSADIR